MAGMVGKEIESLPTASTSEVFAYGELNLNFAPVHFAVNLLTFVKHDGKDSRPSIKVHKPCKAYMKHEKHMPRQKEGALQGSNPTDVMHVLYPPATLACSGFSSKPST